MKVISLVLAMAAPAMASPSGPAETAVHFLGKIRTQTLNLEPGGDTALAPQTSTAKRQEIARRLQRVAHDLGDDPLEVGAVKLDDDLAAVLVRKIGGMNPAQLRVFPVALVKRGADWLATPVPASFENSGVGYATAKRHRLALLEEWMLREQARDLELLRDQAADRLRLKIAASLPPATLRALTATQAAERFLTACGQGNLPEILGLLGGLSTALPDNWPLRLQAAEAAVSAATEVPPPWRLVMSPDVLRAIVHHETDGDTAQISIACLDPAGNPTHSALPGAELIHLQLAKSPDGLWRIDPPASFLQAQDPAEDTTDEDLDADLLNELPVQLAAGHPLSPRPTAQQLLAELLAALQQESPAALMRFIRLDGDPAAARAACARATQLRWTLRAPATVACAVPLAFHTEGDLAAAACQCFSVRNPERFNLKILYFNQSAAGWSWMPEPPLAAVRALRAWTDLQSQRWPDLWQQQFLTDSCRLARLPEAAAPTEQESRQVIEAWLRATRAGEVMAALRLTARLSTPDSDATLLRNLGYEMAGTRHNSPAPTLTGIHRSGIWSAVGTRSDPDGKPTFPLYPIVLTPAGPRILLEIDLFASANRSRDFLNQTALERLRQSSPTAAAVLKSLFAAHQAKVLSPPPP